MSKLLVGISKPFSLLYGRCKNADVSQTRSGQGLLVQQQFSITATRHVDTKIEASTNLSRCSPIYMHIRLTLGAFFISLASPIASCVKTFRISKGWTLDFFFFIVCEDSSARYQLRDSLIICLCGNDPGLWSRVWLYLRPSRWLETEPLRPPDCRVLSVGFKFH